MMTDQPRVLNKYHDVIPADAIYIGRPTKWGNPFPIDTRKGITKARVIALERYAEWIVKQTDIIEAAKIELKGKDLVCYCAPKECHGDILLRIANE